MKALRMALVLVVVVLWGAFVPAVMAADHCAAMSGLCEGPCGASSTVTAPTAPRVTAFVSRAGSMSLPAVPQPDRPALEPPPRPLARSA
jgi:hypothetical protein